MILNVVGCIGCGGCGFILQQKTEEEQHLTPEMDVFSTGCAIAELFLDGVPIFNFAQVRLKSHCIRLCRLKRHNTLLVPLFML